MKHIHCTDVAAHFSHKIFIPEKGGWKVKVIWFNISTSKPMAICDDKIFIKQEDMKNWKKYV